MTAFESGVQAAVIKYLKSVGAVVTNFWGNEHMPDEIDLVVCYKGRYIGLECKSATGTLEPHQKRRLRQVQKAQGIGEAVRGINKVKRIIESIDKGEAWPNTDYRR